MFLSIKRHLEQNPSELAAALLQLSGMLLRALRLYSVRGDEIEFHRFQAGVLQLENRIGESQDPAEVLIAAGEAVRAFEDHSYQTTRFMQAQSAELTKMISMLTGTIATISSSSQIAIAQLSRVERRIEQMAAMGDLTAIKAELAECLALVREESIRQRDRTNDAIHAVQRGISDSRQHLDASSGRSPHAKLEPLLRDPATGLPGRADAEDALTCARGNSNLFAVILPIDRFALIQSRFGAESTDRVAAFMATHAIRHLQPEDQLFRWSSNAFIALIERTQPADTVRAEVARFASQKLEMPLEHHGREIHLPLSSCWISFAVAEGRSRDALIAKIDSFLRDNVHAKETFA